MVDQPGKPRRLWRIVLVISLALNLVIVGLAVGAVASGRAGDGPPRSFSFGAGPMSAALTQMERRQMGRALREQRVIRDLDVRGRVATLTDALRSEPFDAAAFGALLDDQVAQMTDLQAKAQEALLGVITEMSPERRIEFADQLEQELAKSRQRQPRQPSGG